MRHDRMSTSRPPGRLARVRDEAEPPAPSIAREHDRYRTRPASERARGGAPPRALCRDPAPRRPASACVRAARGCGRRSPGAAPRRRPRRRSGTLVARARRLTQLLLAEDPDEEEDRAEREPREDDRKRTRRADGDEAEVDVEAEGGRPQERGDATVDARWPQVGHRRILGQALPVDLDDLGRLDRHPLVVGAAPGVLHGLVREPGALPGSLVELAHPRPQPRDLGVVLAECRRAELELRALELDPERRELPARGEELAAGPRPGARRSGGEAEPVAEALGEADRRPRRGVARPEASRRLHEQAREDEAAERDDCSEHPVAGGERERADGQRYEAETERRERRHDPEQARLDSVERQGARFGGGYRMATARAEACSDRERVGAAGARLLHGCAVPGPAQSESGGGALRGSCQALREPSGSLRRPSPWSASRTDAASDHSFAEPVTLSSTAPADLSPWPCGLLVRPSGSVSTYSRPVLGASGTLGRCKWVFKTSGEAESAICEVFNFPHFHSRSCSLWKKPEKRLRARSTRSRVRSAPRARRT